MSDAALASLSRRIEALEAAAEIRRVIARYMEICDSLGAETPVDELGELFCVDAIWEGVGNQYAAGFGMHRGRSAIADFLLTYARPAPAFADNAHFLCSESLGVHGERAAGSWMMLQTPTFANGESFFLGARLSIDFQREEGVWRIRHFRTANVLRRRIEGRWREDATTPASGFKAKRTPKKRVQKGGADVVHERETRGVSIDRPSGAGA